MITSTRKKKKKERIKVKYNLIWFITRRRNRFLSAQQLLIFIIPRKKNATLMCQTARPIHQQN